MSRSKNELEWENDQERQRLWIQVDSWQYKVFVESFKSHRTIFQFEGVVSQGSRLTGLRALGDIEIPIDLFQPPPLNAQGTVHLVEEEGERDPFLGVTLLVNSEAHAELFRVFSATFASNGGLGLELHLKHPKGSEPDFWRIGWQKENIQVSDFGFYSGGHFREIKGLAKLFC